MPDLIGIPLPVIESTSPEKYTFDLANVSLQELKSAWYELEERAHGNFFLSWRWVEAWLAAFAPSYRVVRAFTGSELVALGLVTLHSDIRHKILRSKAVRLTRTGRQEEDQIWIEYNGLLIDQKHQLNVPSAFMHFMLQDPTWDEFELGASATEQLQLYQAPGCTSVIKWSSPTYGVNLNTLRSSGASYLTSLSRNTRYQISRSQKIYASRGTLEFRAHNTLDSIEKIWPKLAILHKQRWGTGLNGSGFFNAKFVAFHEALIRGACPDGAIEFCTLTLDNHLIGCLYNFVYRDRVYFYLSGLEYESDPHLKPGMLLHALAIQQYLERGLHYYDFLGGDSRYKASLGQRGTELQLISHQRPRLKLKLERLARHIKAWRNSNTVDLE